MDDRMTLPTVGYIYCIYKSRKLWVFFRFKSIELNGPAWTFTEVLKSPGEFLCQTTAKRGGEDGWISGRFLWRESPFAFLFQDLTGWWSVSKTTYIYIHEIWWRNWNKNERHNTSNDVSQILNRPKWISRATFTPKVGLLTKVAKTAAWTPQPGSTKNVAP